MIFKKETEKRLVREIISFLYIFLKVFWIECAFFIRLSKKKTSSQITLTLQFDYLLPCVEYVFCVQFNFIYLVLFLYWMVLCLLPSLLSSFFVLFLSFSCYDAHSNINNSNDIQINVSIETGLLKISWSLWSLWVIQFFFILKFPIWQNDMRKLVRKCKKIITHQLYSIEQCQLLRAFWIYYF